MQMFSNLNLQPYLFPVCIFIILKIHIHQSNKHSNIHNLKSQSIGLQGKTAVSHPIPPLFEYPYSQN